MAEVRAPLADLRPPASLQPDELLGAWRILHLIGHGGMGAVYRAERADQTFSAAGERYGPCEIHDPRGSGGSCEVTLPAM